jgi:hypothetical protein
MIALNWATLDAGGNPDDSTWLRYLDAPGIRGRLWWALMNNDPASRHVIRFPTMQTNVRQAAPWFVNGIFLGRDDFGLSEDPPKVSFTAAPELPNTQYSGDPLTYERGDVVWNSKPSPGGPIGQVCIRSGTQSLPLGIQTADPVNATDTTLKLSRVDLLKPGQYITIGEGADVYMITEVKPGDSTIDITPGALAVVPVGKAIAFSPATFSSFGEVVNIGNSTAAASKVLTLADRYVTVTATESIMTLPKFPVDGQTHDIKSGTGVTTTVKTEDPGPPLLKLKIDGQESVTLGPGDNGTFRYSAVIGEWEIR